MKSKNKYLAKNTALFFVSSFGSKILSFLLVPLYTAILSTEDYGVADIVSTTSVLLYYILTINIAEAVLRFALDKESDKNGIFSYGLSVTMKGSAVFLPLLAVFTYVNPLGWERYCYVFLFCQYLFTALYHLFTNYLRAIDKVKDVAVVGLLSTAVVIVSNIVSLIVLKIGLVGYMLSQVLGYAIPLLFCVFRAHIPLRYYYKNTCSPFIRREIIAFSVPLIFNSIAWWMNSSLDRYFVTAICGVAANGLYAVASKIPSILMTVNYTFAQAWNLSAIKEYDENDKDGFFENTYDTYNAFLVIGCSILIICNVSIARILFSNDFYEAWRFSSILLISIVFSALGTFVGSIFSAAKDSKVSSYSTVIAAVMNTVLNGLLIPSLGVLGAVIATLVSFICIWLIRIVISKRYISWRIKWLRDFVSYVLLLAQVFFEHQSGHGYLQQVIILLIILVLYWNRIFQLITSFGIKIKNLVLMEK